MLLQTLEFLVSARGAHHQPVVVGLCERSYFRKMRKYVTILAQAVSQNAKQSCLVLFFFRFLRGFLGGELAVEGRDVDAEQRGGLLLVAVGDGERLADRGLLDLLERRADRQDHDVAAAPLLADRRRQVLLAQQRLARHDDQLLDDVLQLAHVARPGVGRHRLEAVLGDPLDLPAGLRRCTCWMKCPISSGMSPVRSRSGGTWIEMTLRR